MGGASQRLSASGCLAADVDSRGSFGNPSFRSSSRARVCSRQRAPENHGRGSTNFSCSCVESVLNPLDLWVTKQIVLLTPLWLKSLGMYELPLSLHEVFGVC